MAPHVPDLMGEGGLGLIGAATAQRKELRWMRSVVEVSDRRAPNVSEQRCGGVWAARGKYPGGPNSHQ
jgi:hypothetical protein